MIGDTISHYRITGRVGAGGMGEVFQAEDLKLGRHVALKFLPVDLVGDSQAVKRFLWEARSLSALNHPNICTIYEVDEHQGRPFIAMELLEGQALNHFIKGRPLPTAQIVDLATQMADGLEAAHQQGLLHRDIKPANIFITRRDQAKILDFGLAKLTHDAHAATTGPGDHALRDVTTTPGITMGTVAYMSPEQARGEELDHRSDLFSFGLVLYEMATGRQTFSGNTTAVIFDGILNRDPIPAGELNPVLPAELERIIGKALEKDRRLRYQSASDLRADLQRLRRELESGRHVASSAAMQALKGGATLPPVTSPVPVAAPATGAAAAAVAIPSAAQPAGGPVQAGARKLKPRRTGVLIVAASAAVLVVAVGYLAWRNLAGRPGPAVEQQAPAAQAAPPGVATSPVAPKKPVASSTAVPTRGGDGGPQPQPAAADSDSAKELSAAKARIDAREFEPAIADLQKFLVQHPASPLAPEAVFLKGQAQEMSGQTDAAIATYGDIRARYRGAARMPDATFRLAQLIGTSQDRASEAITLYSAVFSQYPNSPRAPEALFAKASLQDRLKLVEVDPELSVSVPASLMTYRTLADRYPRAALTQHALFRTANMYDALKRYDLEALAFERLGAWFPQSNYDGWFKAAELYDRRLKDKEKARAAYLQVPPTSPRYKDAQKRAGR